jgi:hypothetical protein
MRTDPWVVQNVSSWPISEVAARLIEVRSTGRSGLDLLTLSSSHFDSEPPSAPTSHRDAAFPSAACDDHQYVIS